jgi:hypothetical protein
MFKEKEVCSTDPVAYLFEVCKEHVRLQPLFALKPENHKAKDGHQQHTSRSKKIRPYSIRVADIFPMKKNRLA